MIPVCYNNIGRHEAETLCSSSGRGLLVNRGIQRGYTEVNGVMLIKSNLAETILPGIDFGQRRYCYPLILNCKLPDCGTSSIVDNFISPLIPHGNEAVLGARPYHGSLRKNNKLHCGCTVIGGQWVLTAAHCVEYSVAYAYTVILGSIESDKVGEHGQQFSVIDIVSHPQYNADDVTKGYDVALLKLAHAPNFDNYTRPACLGTKTSWQYILDIGDQAECYITGFGANELYLARDDNSDKVLDESRVGIINRKTCQEKYTETGSGNVSHDGICVENRTPYQAACYGDSGGPLVCRNEIGRWELFGDLSYGSYDCTYDTPSIYFAVTSQREWIKSVTGLQFPDDYRPVYDSDDAP
ncbi:chymotrypsin-like elastase family member 2A [Ruditapes philippinarum]|uniref:chymotrypsin-like elastase family member 2A n=1 Tax=Ruditapes philippinarum TaxID=129788 RepID=UPI00295A5983|nr:chymotrypsin-like elastase family member 2A [Ruditapes philippinarum]